MAVLTRLGARPAVVPYVTATRTAGDVSLNTASITEVNSGLRLTLPAAVGDVLEFGIDAQLDSTAQFVGFDVYTMPGGTRTNPFGPGLSANLSTLVGVVGWEASNAAAARMISGSVTRTVVSGDLDAGSPNTVTASLHFAKVNATARALFAQTNIPLKVWMKNLGH